MAAMYLDVDVYYPETLVYAEQLYGIFKLLECFPKKLPENIAEAVHKLNQLKAGDGDELQALYTEEKGYLCAHQVFKYSERHHFFHFFLGSGAEHFGLHFGLLLLKLGACRVKGNVDCEYFVTEDGRQVSGILDLSPEQLELNPKAINWQFPGAE